MAGRPPFPAVRLTITLVLGCAPALVPWQVTRQITKHNFLVMDVKDIPRIVKEAFYLARTGRPGEAGGTATALVLLP